MACRKGLQPANEAKESVRAPLFINDLEKVRVDSVTVIYISHNLRADELRARASALWPDQRARAGVRLLNVLF